RAIQIACRCFNRTPGIAAEPPNGVRDGAWICGVRMVRPRCTTRNRGVHCKKDQRRPTSGTGPAGCPPEIPGLPRLDARDVAATACRLHRQRAEIVEAGDRADGPCDPIALAESLQCLFTSGVCDGR